ncbi:MAG: YibE/F family protein [bacterium]|nr:YibE/F family protein [bacterium]
MKKMFMCVLLSILFFPSVMGAQVLHQDIQETLRAKVVEVVSQERREVPGTDTISTYQTIRAEIIEGDKTGQIVTIENDYLVLKEGDKFFMNHIITINGNEMYSVRDIDRRAVIIGFIILFALVIVGFGGKQGLRSLLSLAASLFVVLYVLVPGLLNGYPPVLMSIAIAALILFFAIYFTHGFNRESTVAFIGTVTAVIMTGLLAYLGVYLARLSGLASDEAIFLNLSTRGNLDFSGLLLGAMIIGVLGVLDDIAVTQAAVVSELFNTDRTLSRKDVYKKAIRVGKEHVGALVNTLALAYTGASLPLLLLFSTSESSAGSIINLEIFATEIIRTIVGSIGLVLTVPITTLLAVYLLKNYTPKHIHSHSHSHAHHTH